MPESIPLFIEPAFNRISSLYYTTRDLLEASLKRKDEIKFLMLHPNELGDGDEHWGLSQKGVVRFIPYDEDNVVKQPLGYVNSSFKSLSKQKDYYVIFNARPTASHMLQKVCGIKFAGFYPSILIHHRYNYHRQEPAFSLDPSTRIEVLAAAAQHYNLFTNETNFKHVTKMMSELFVPSVVANFAHNSAVVNLGIPLHRVDKIPPQKKDPTKFVMVYGGRLSPQKRPELSVAVAEALYKMGVPVVLKIFAVLTELGIGKGEKAKMGREEMLNTYRKHPFIELHINKSQTEFLTMAKGADAFICASAWESFGGVYAELLACGLVGVFFDRTWVDAFLPTWYKYRGVKNSQEAVGIMLGLWKKKGDDTEVKNVVEHLRKNQSREVGCSRTIDLLVELSKARRERRKFKRLSDLGR